MPKKKPTDISISTSTIIKLLLVLGGIAFVWFIRDIVAVFFVALLLAALIDPFADWFEKRKIPRGVGVLVVYIVLAVVLSVVLLLVIPPLVAQLADLGKSLALTFGDAKGYVDDLLALSAEYGLSESVSDGVAGLQTSITEGLSRLFATVAGAVGGVATLILVMVLAFYMVVEEGVAKKAFRHLAPKKYQPYLVGLAHRIQGKLSHWLRGQILLMLIVGALTYVGLLIIGVEYPLALGIFAGVAEIVPYAGPIIAAIPAIIIAFTVSPIKAVIVAVLYFAIQQLENSVLTPKIMQKSVGLNPLISLFALMVGFKIGGLVGALLAIPVATIVTVLLKDLVDEYDSRHAK